jgi:hypothetical protein
MILKILVAGMAVALLSMPAMAATQYAATQYYLGHAPNQKICHVVQVKPDGKKLIEAGKAYNTMAAANAAMKTLAACY